MKKREFILLLFGIFFVISGIGWYGINVIIPQKEQMNREQNMRMWSSKGRQFLSRMGDCEETSNVKDFRQITGYDESKKADETTAQKSCRKAKEQVQDILEWCAVDIPQQLQQEGLERNNNNYQEKKYFLLNLCDVLQKSDFGKEK